jgi:hypothetical protein
MSPFIASATNRMPILKEAPYEMLLNTPDAFTPDGRWILGELIIIHFSSVSL